MARILSKWIYSDTVKSNFAGSGGVTIVHNLDLHNYEAMAFSTADGNGAIGEICITDVTDNSFVVRNSGSATTEFTWIVYDQT